MSHVARLSRWAGLALVVAACSSPKPPASETPSLSESESNGESEPVPPEAAPVEPAGEHAPSGEAARDAPVVETLFVRETVAECQAEGTQPCLQVRSSELEDWRNFYGRIEGFDYEPSHAYELRVAVSPVPDAPADAPALRYRLVEVVSKRKAGKPAE